MFCAPIPRRPQSTARDERSASTTKVVKSRLNRFFAGDWVNLWEEANDHPEGTIQVRTRDEAAEKHAKLARARHFALAAQLRDAHQCLTNTGLLPIADSDVLSQFDELFVRAADADPIPSAPDDLQDDTAKYGCTGMFPIHGLCII